MITTNGDWLEEPIIFVEYEMPPYLHISDIDNPLYENQKFKSVGTTKYKHSLNAWPLSTKFQFCLPAILERLIDDVD